MDELNDFRQVAVEAGMAMEVASSLTLHEEMGFKVAFRPGTADEGVLEHSFGRDIYLKGVPEYQPRGSDVIVEIGGHLGDFALLMSRFVSKVFTIEARKETFALLKANIQINSATNVVADHLAIADSEGQVTLYHAPEGDNWADSITFNWNAMSEQVASTTLEKYFSERGIEHVDFLKLNCEGAEFPILLSSLPKTLARCAIGLILFHENLAAGYSEEMLTKHLTKAGFKVSVRQRNQALRWGWIIAVRN